MASCPEKTHTNPHLPTPFARTNQHLLCRKYPWNELDNCKATVVGKLNYLRRAGYVVVTRYENRGLFLTDAGSKYLASRRRTLLPVMRWVRLEK